MRPLVVFLLGWSTFAILTSPTYGEEPQLKPRLLVLTDISTWEPDDSESLVRLLVYADRFEIEGLVLTTGWSMDRVRDDFLDLLHDAIDAYETDLPHLMARSERNEPCADEAPQSLGEWPSPRYLKSRTVIGSRRRGAEHVGPGNDSDGSDLIIRLVDEDDERPLWISVWGGGNTLAQAIWRVRQDRTSDELDRFLSRLRGYAITDQDREQRTPFSDSSHLTLRREYGRRLFLIWDESAWKYHNGHGRELWSDYETHVQGHGALGAIYPKYVYGVEGDTPAFLHLLPQGLNDPNVPTHGGWGGYFEWGPTEDGETECLNNHRPPASSISRSIEETFYPEMFADFAARMDWARDGKGNRNPRLAIGDDRSPEIVELNPRVGSTITLDMTRSLDPDGDHLTFACRPLETTGGYQGTFETVEEEAGRFRIKVPADASGKELHLICRAIDDGTPSLVGYRRVILRPID